MGKRYRALTGLHYPVGQSNIERAKRGHLAKVTQWKEVAAGEVADDIPAISVASLLRRGKIEEVSDGVYER